MGHTVTVIKVNGQEKDNGKLSKLRPSRFAAVKEISCLF